MTSPGNAQNPTVWRSHTNIICTNIFKKKNKEDYLIK